MTVPTQRRRVRYVANGTSRVFAIPFTFIAAEAIDVRVFDARSRDITRLASFAIGGGAPPRGLPATGSVTFDLAPTSGSEILIRGRQAIDQTTTYGQADRFPAQSHERALDKGTIIDQELRDDTDANSDAIAILQLSVRRSFLDFGTNPRGTAVLDFGDDPDAAGPILDHGDL